MRSWQGTLLDGPGERRGDTEGLSGRGGEEASWPWGGPRESGSLEGKYLFSSNEKPPGFLFFFFNKFFLFYLFILGCVGSSLWCSGFSLQWPLLLRSMGSRHAGSVVVARGFSSCGSRALERRLSSCGARA